jgi:peptidoglycan/LPS O-acetylase OafA/YrhL
MRFPAIDGLRAWLAWTVVAAHIVQATGLDQLWPAMGLVRELGSKSVMVFIMISGFVIAGLLVEKQERWAPFIVRRAMRIYPVYLVGLAAATAVLFLMPGALARETWLGASDYAPLVNDILGSVSQRPAAEGLLDLTLMQGVVPDGVIRSEQFTVLAPAWSLSLEWQFYLVAPFLVTALRRPGPGVAATLACIAAFAAHRAGLLGHFNAPSFLPAAILHFLIGIGTRLAIDRFAGLPASVAAGVGALSLLGGEAAPVFFWLAFIVFMMRGEAWRGGLADALGRAGRLAFESAPARFLGERSYASYVMHWPLIQLSLVAALHVAPTGQLQTAGIVTAASAALTLAASWLLYERLERPAMRLGAAWAARLSAGSGRPAPDAA